MGIRRCRRATLANHLGGFWASMGIGSGEVPLRQLCPLTSAYHGLMHEGTRASALRCVSMTACESGRGPLVGADELRRARRRVPSDGRGRGPRQAPLGLTAARVCRSACSFVPILSLAGLRASATLARRARCGLFHRWRAGVRARALSRLMVMVHHCLLPACKSVCLRASLHA